MEAEKPITMTVKKIAENCKQQISDEDYIYVFIPTVFDEFCKQLCKEQRENCADEWGDIEIKITRSGHYNDIQFVKDSIEDAPEPELK